MTSALRLKVIIGHRGTGKSSFLKRCLENFPEAGPFYDLDTEIEKEQGRSIEEIFLADGENIFRNLESKVFKKLASNAKLIAVGGGFNLENIPDDIEVIWLRRTSDLLGRIFTDRPQLLIGTEPLLEFETKRKEREAIFAARANIVYILPEGLGFSQSAKNLEKQLFLPVFTSLSIAAVINVKGVKTNFPNDFYLQALGAPDFYELRDDLLSPLEMKQFSKNFEGCKSLYSFRVHNLAVQKENEKIISDSVWLDWPIDGIPKVDIKKEGQTLIRSSHQDNIYSGIQELEHVPSVHLKLSPMVLHWKDLMVGHQWQQQDVKNRSFLPRSIEGRWKWYRLYQKGRQKLNFWYDSQSSAPDQPSLFEWMLQPENVSSFAAVLGSPVQQSLSPMMHYDFFKDRKNAFFAIEIKKEEWSEALPILQSLGLVAAAVTSPLKKVAYEATYLLTDLAKELNTVNTLAWNPDIKNWQAENTDYLGFTKFLKSRNLSGPAVIWGGEGVLPMLKKVWPEAASYSARTGKPKEGNSEIDSPSVVIWAAPSKSEINFPPKHWRPDVIIDLNYAENSLGRQYAMQSRIKYISGLDFFRFQALEQQKFWNQFLV